MVTISGSTWNKWLTSSQEKKRRQRRQKKKKQKRSRAKRSWASKLKSVVAEDQERSTDLAEAKKAEAKAKKERERRESKLKQIVAEDQKRAGALSEAKEREEKREAEAKRQQQKKRDLFKGDLLGVNEWSSSEDADRLRDEVAKASDKRGSFKGDRSLGGHLGRLGADFEKFDARTKAGLDVVFDNPKASVQDTSRGVLRSAYSAGAGRGVTDEELVEAYADAAGGVKDRWDRSTPDSTGLKAAGWLTDALIADPAKAAGTLLTGVDIDERSSEGNVGAVDAFDVGVTVGTAGLGSAGVKAAKAASKSGKSSGLLARLLGRNADETARTARTATRSTEDAGKVLTTGTAATTAARSSDDLAGRIGRVIDEFSAGSDDAAKLGDEAARSSDDLARTGDDLARTIDDVATLADDTGTLSDDLARTTDEIVQTGDDAPSFLKRTLTSNSVKVATGVGGGVVGGGILYDYIKGNDQITVTDPETGEHYILTKTDSLTPTDTHTEGGSVWEVAVETTETTTDPETNEERTVSTGTRTIGYTVVVGVAGQNVWILGSNGERRRSRATGETWAAARNARRGGS